MHDQVALITMDDGKANACGKDMLSALNAALDKAEAAGAKALVLAGRPGRFCAGFDLRTMQGASAEQVDKLVNYGGGVVLRLFESKLPVVVACTGHAMALGAVWLLVGDTRIGTRGDYKIGLNETAIGMVLPTFGIEPAKLRLEKSQLLAVTVQARIFDPDGAVAAGFLDWLVDEGETVDAAVAAANELAKLPGAAYAGTKRAIRAGAIDRIRSSLSG